MLVSRPVMVYTRGWIKGADESRWASRTSNPLGGIKHVFGGFDSHALPPEVYIHMEYANLIKIGLLLEVIGFVMASFFIALLNIKSMKRIFSQIINGILWFPKNLSTNIDRKVSGMLFKVVFYEIWKWNTIKINIEEWIKRYIPKIKKWQYPILVFPFLGHFLKGIIYMVFTIFLVTMNYLFFLPLIWIGKKMSESDAVRNLMIVLGAIIVLVGLIIQICAVW